MKLICESDFHDYDFIIEQQNKESPRFYKIRGPYIIAEKKNANGRKYSRELMEKVVNTFTESMINTGRAFGELNHPPHTNINFERVCHRVTGLKQEGNMWIGESIVLSSSADGSIKATPMGDILASILQHGGKPGVSTRGVGEINENNEIKDNFSLIAIDAVSDPSGPGCFVNGILESKSFMINTHGDIIEQAYVNLENGLKEIPSHSIKTDEGKIYVESLLNKFLNSI